MDLLCEPDVSGPLADLLCTLWSSCSLHHIASLRPPVASRNRRPRLFIPGPRETDGVYLIISGEADFQEILDKDSQQVQHPLWLLNTSASHRRFIFGPDTPLLVLPSMDLGSIYKYSVSYAWIRPHVFHITTSGSFLATYLSPTAGAPTGFSSTLPPRTSTYFSGCKQEVKRVPANTDRVKMIALFVLPVL